MSLASSQQLLSEAGELIRRRSREARERGLEFNLFDILGLANKEVSGHSRFLAALLDPNGCHGQGDVFLRRFLKTLAEVSPALAGGLPRYDNPWRVCVERHCGIAVDEPEGRMDILLESGDLWVIVENKIYAGDQDRQLQRYADHAMRSGKRHILVYLTLDGGRPGDTSLGKLQASEVICIGYGAEIESWLTECVEIMKGAPAISEILQQYVRLVRRLTGSGALEELQMELRDLLLLPGNMEAALEISYALPKAKEYVNLQFWNDVRDAMVTLGIEPRDLIAGFAPDPQTIANFYSPRRSNPKGVGYCFPLLVLSPKRQLAMLITADRSVYFAFAVIENNEWADLTTQERSAIRQACSRANLPNQDKDSSWSVWLHASPGINLKKFGSRESRMTEPALRKQWAGEIATEAANVLERMKAALNDGVYV